MADWYGHARSNYFRVKDLDAFKLALAPVINELDIWTHTNAIHDEPIDDRVALGASSYNGGWPTTCWNEEADDNDDFDLQAVVAEHLVNGEVAVFMECGAEKLRYLTGRAVAINAAGEVAYVDIDDIYAKAKALTERPGDITHASY